MTDTTETRWFKIVTVFGTGIATAAFVANAIYFARIKDGSCNAVTSGEATTLLWINIILAIVIGLHFIWSLWRLIFAREFRQGVSTSVKHYFRGDSSGLISADALHDTRHDYVHNRHHVIHPAIHPGHHGSYAVQNERVAGTGLIPQHSHAHARPGHTYTVGQFYPQSSHFHPTAISHAHGTPVPRRRVVSAPLNTLPPLIPGTGAVISPHVEISSSARATEMAFAQV